MAVYREDQDEEWEKGREGGRESGKGGGKEGKKQTREGYVVFGREGEKKKKTKEKEKEKKRKKNISEEISIFRFGSSTAPRSRPRREILPGVSLRFSLAGLIGIDLE